MILCCRNGTKRRRKKSPIKTIHVKWYMVITKSICSFKVTGLLKTACICSDMNLELLLNIKRANVSTLKRVLEFLSTYYVLFPLWIKVWVTPSMLSCVLCTCLQVEWVKNQMYSHRWWTSDRQSCAINLRTLRIYYTELWLFYYFMSLLLLKIALKEKKYE